MKRKALSDSGCVHNKTAKKRHSRRTSRITKNFKRIPVKKPQTAKDININITVDLNECSNASSVNAQSKSNLTETNDLSNKVYQKSSQAPIGEMVCGLRQTKLDESTEQTDSTNVSALCQSQNKSSCGRKRKRVSRKVEKLCDSSNSKKRSRKVKSKNSSLRKSYFSKKKKSPSSSKISSSKVTKDKRNRRSPKDSCKMIDDYKRVTNYPETQNKSYSCPAKTEIKDKVSNDSDVTSKPTNHNRIIDKMINHVGIVDKPSCNTTAISKPSQSPILTPKDKSICNIPITNKLSQSPIVSPKEKPIYNTIIKNQPHESQILSPKDKPICNSHVLNSTDKTKCDTGAINQPQTESYFNSTSLCPSKELKPSNESSKTDKKCLPNTLSTEMKEQSSGESASKVSGEIKKNGSETSDQTQTKPCNIKNQVTPGISSTETCNQTSVPCSSTSKGCTPTIPISKCDSIGAAPCPSKSITPSPCSTRTNTSVSCAPVTNNSTGQTKSETCDKKSSETKSPGCTTSSDNKIVVSPGCKIPDTSPKPEDDICKCPQKETKCKENQSVFTEICGNCLKNKSNNNDRKKPIYKGLENQNLFGTPKTKIEKE